MLLDFSKIKLLPNGTPERPVLVLKTLAEQTLGVISNAYDVRFEINLADLSTIEFTVPYMVDGVVTPLYDQIVGYKVVWTEAYGIYVLTRPQITGDGVKEVKQVTGYSLEYLREKKQLFLEEGLYKFWNIPGERQNTILGRIAEMFPGWEVSCNDTKLIDTYRYFDQLDVDALGFCYNDVADKFHCIIAFDVYSKTIHAFDANTTLGALPIYLSFENLVQSVDVTELTDEIKTKIHVYGADDLSIASVNPMGTDYIVDLSFFVGRGDLGIKVGDSTQTLESKYFAWQNDMLSRQEFYSGLVAQKSTLSLQKLILESELAEIKGEIETLKIQQNVDIQALANETTDVGKKAINERLASYKTSIEGWQEKMDAKNDEIEEIDAEIERATKDIENVTKEMKMSAYFSPTELSVLEEFLIEGDIVEETFVASDVDATVDGVTTTLNDVVKIENADITFLDMENPYNQEMYGVSGGQITVGDPYVRAEIIIPAGELLETTDEEGNVVSVSDSLGNWTLSPNHETEEMQFYTDLLVEGIPKLAIAVVHITKPYNEDLAFFAVQLIAGGIRLYAKSLPTNAIQATVRYIKDDDTATASVSYGVLPEVSKMVIQADIVRGTMERKKANSSIVFSIYLGTTILNEKRFENGTLTFTGVVSEDIESDIAERTVDDITEHKGSKMTFRAATSEAGQPNVFFSVSSNEYKEFSVARNLFDYGVEALAELSTPTYEFSIDSTNFLFLEEFTRFKDEFELGKGIYLNLASEGVITPNVIGVGVDFTKESKLELTFSNRYKKKNGFKTLESMIKKSYSSGRDFDASKYIIGKVVNQASNVSEYMNKNFDTATQTIVGAKDQSVVVDGAGINVTNTTQPNYQLRIVNGMIAFTRDGWRSSDIAIGYFNTGMKDPTSETGGNLIGGVNAQLLAGKLIIGNNLVIENNNADGTVKQFKVDGSGAWLNNSTFILQKGDGQILIDPNTGIAAGKNVFGLTATNDGVTSSLYKKDSSGNDTSEYHSDIGFHLDIANGDAYFKGEVQAGSGSIGGWKIEDNQLTCGSGDSFVALNSSSESNALYAIWAGASTGASAPFSVDRKGNVIANKLKADNMVATNAQFDGNINASTINGKVDFGNNGSISLGTAGQIKQNKAKFYRAEIYGGLFYATGLGSTGTGAAYYIHSGDVNESNPSANRVGFISYDTSGADNTNEAKNRVIFKTLNSTALKIESSANISMSSSVTGGYIHIGSPLHIRSKLVVGSDVYGAKFPDPATQGQIFFLLDES